MSRPQATRRTLLAAGCLSAVGLAIGIAVFIAAGSARESAPGPGPVDRPSAPAAKARTTPPDAERRPALKGQRAGGDPTPPAFAPSLRGTTVDGGFEVDAQGHLRVTRGTRDLFDYFMSTAGERSRQDIIEHIEQRARADLPAQAAAEAVDLLHAYVDYRKQARQYLARDVSAQTPQARLETLEHAFHRMQAIRREHFSATQANAFFGAEEAYATYVLQRMRIQSDPGLSDRQKKERMADIERNAPRDITQVKRHATERAVMARQVDRMRRDGASDAEVLRYRTDRVGAREARRLAGIDADNARWEHRYGDYSRERDAIVASTGLSESDKQVSIRRLRQRYFHGPGRMRAKARDTTELKSSSAADKEPNPDH